MQFGVVAFQHGFDSAFTTVCDVLGVAEVLRPRVDEAIPPFATTVAGFGPRVRTARGLRVDIEHRLDIDGVAGLDTLVIPALDALDAASLETALTRPDVRALRAFLADLADADGSVGLAAACTGTFVLAEAGLLDHRRATTTWWLTGLFERRYPKVELDMTRMVVVSGGLTTAGAAFAHIDLAVSLVSRISPALADAVARHLLVDERPAPSIEAALGHLADTDRLVLAFETDPPAPGRSNRDRRRRSRPPRDAAYARAPRPRSPELQSHERSVRRLRVEQANRLRRHGPRALRRADRRPCRLRERTIAAASPGSADCVRTSGGNGSSPSQGIV